MKSRTSIIALISGFLVLVGATAALSYFLIPGTTVSYDDQVAQVGAIASTSIPVAAAGPKPRVVTHVKTPDAVRGVYMTACIGGEKRLRDNILTTIAGTDVNSIVLDIKDYTGTLAYASSSVVGPRGKGCKMYDLPEFLAELHEKGIYAIARVTVFQDPLYATAHPDVAVQSISRPGHPWTDKNGLAFIDPDFVSYWDYIVAIAKEAHDIGFDEINFDYIRFPSDGDMSDVQFALPAGATKASVITGFFEYLHEMLSPAGIVISGDIFGQTTINHDDMGIGQILENALPYFDYVLPMTYPSHFIHGFMGYENPAAFPYEIIKGTMMSAVERAAAASTSPLKIRPWLQAFDLGAIYTPEMVRKQIQAVYDSGLTSWILWDAANRYKREALMM